MSISVDHLSKNYGSQVAVNAISFSISKGEIVGFLGPNGAGKSTTMKMITGFLAPDAGSIDVCDLPVKENNTATKKKIGYLPESNPLYTEMYVKEYLGFIAGIHQVAQPAKRIAEVIKLVGLTPEAHKKIGQLLDHGIEVRVLRIEAELAGVLQEIRQDSAETFDLASERAHNGEPPRSLGSVL